PGTPMLFQGQEFAAPSPFLYFADNKPEIAALAKQGRIDFLSQFRSLARPDLHVADPRDPLTFARSKLDHEGRERNQSVWRRIGISSGCDGTTRCLAPN